MTFIRGHESSERLGLMRKVIQISSTDKDVLALCDDSTIWIYTSNGYGWYKLPSVPQTKQEEDSNGCSR